MSKKTVTSIIMILIAAVLFLALAFSVVFYLVTLHTGGAKEAALIVLCVCSALFFVALFLTSLFGCYSFRYFADKKKFDISKKGNTEELTVMSFNLRCTAMQDIFKKGWYYRAELVRRTLFETAPDVIGFQEINTAHEHYLRSHLIGYSFFVAYRTNDYFKEGLMIAYRSDRFVEVDKGRFWLSETPEKMSKSWDAGCSRIALYLQLNDKATGKIFTIVNTHLDNAGEIARVKGMDVITEQGKKREWDATILMGDMNDIEGSPMYLEALNNGFVDGQKTATEIYTGKGSTWHGYGKYPNLERIDFFFLSPGLNVKKYFVYDKAYNGVYPSDHYPIVMEVTL